MKLEDLEIGKQYFFIKVADLFGVYSVSKIEDRTIYFSYYYLIDRYFSKQVIIEKKELSFDSWDNRSLKEVVDNKRVIKQIRKKLFSTIFKFGAIESENVAI